MKEKVTLDGKEISVEQLQEEMQDKSKRVVLVSENNYKSQLKMMG